MFFFNLDINFIYYFLYIIFYSLLIIICVLISVAYFTLLDRKVMAAVQRRRGPNVVGIWGLLQPLADGLKLLVKETIVPLNANSFLFTLAPIITFVVSLASWVLIPYTEVGSLVDVETGVLFIFAISSFGVYGVILAGWASNSKYAFLGALRASAQMISYEVSIGFIIISVLLCVGSTNLHQIILHQDTFVFWHCWYLWPQFLLFFFSALAETNRAPFDLAEAEAELVAGYFVEYSAMSFALFFLGEYSNMGRVCVSLFYFFCGGWVSPIFILQFPIWLGLKISFFAFCFVWVRATYPRLRYDQLMQLGWKSFLPVSLGLVLVIASFLLMLDGLPNELISG
uniref:NADH-ubiquinone oxidoreductase chain 1 n=1 Tax=Spongospora subterranea TaxID=70186 RepID=A0A096XTW4_9EUKA|nr:NADH dehydrogenase subunit 1 [Spongospora subterranea]AIK19938.1 NADH dehydrogenase subunit 1 [Spongospora subterranea]